MSLTRFVPTPKIEDYREAFKEHYKIERRDDGVIVVQAHTNGGPVQLSVEEHRSVGQRRALHGRRQQQSCGRSDYRLRT